MSSISEEELLQKHRKERKELQAQVQSLKKNCPKGDKKKKKELTETIAQLEKELDEKQEQELLTLEVPLSDEAEVSTNVSEAGDSKNELSEESDNLGEHLRISKAQKRRNKRLVEEKEREQRILEGEKQTKNGPKIKETVKINELLTNMTLKLYSIPPDGNCLYCAIRHQLAITGRKTYTVKELRHLTANFLRANKDDFLPFMTHANSEQMFTEDQYEDYCKTVADTTEWGGEVEIRVMALILKCPIRVVQAESSMTLQGEQFKGPPLTLTYHRHLYGLGEHYNSTVSIDLDNE